MLHLNNLIAMTSTYSICTSTSQMMMLVYRAWRRRSRLSWGSLTSALMWSRKFLVILGYLGSKSHSRKHSLTQKNRSSLKFYSTGGLIWLAWLMSCLSPYFKVCHKCFVEDYEEEMEATITQSLRCQGCHLTRMETTTC